MNNLGEAVLLIGCMYFGFNYGFSLWIILLMFYPILFWGRYINKKENKELIIAKTRYYEEKAHYYMMKNGE